MVCIILIMAHYDELFKHLGEYSPDQLAALALNTEQVRVRDSLNTEQPTVKLHHSDLTFRVSLPDRGEDAILHIEAQTEESRDKPMPLRMLAYVSFLVHQHEMNVYSTVFYLRPPAGQNDPGHYTYGDEVIGGLRFTYNVIRVFELEGESYLDPGTVGLLPFTPLMRPPTGTAPKAWVERCIETTKAAPVDSRTRGTLLYALSVFGGLIHPPELFQDGKLEALMRESPVYETVIQRGIQQGIEQGIEQGKKEHAVEAILTVLEVRFQTDVAEKLKPFLSTIDDLQRLDHLHRVAAQASDIDAFTQVLLNLEN